jgi:hypothetical protein
LLIITLGAMARLGEIMALGITARLGEIMALGITARLGAINETPAAILGALNFWAACSFSLVSLVAGRADRVVVDFAELPMIDFLMIAIVVFPQKNFDFVLTPYPIASGVPNSRGCRNSILRYRNQCIYIKLRIFSFGVRFVLFWLIIDLYEVNF